MPIHACMTATSNVAVCANTATFERAQSVRPRRPTVPTPRGPIPDALTVTRRATATWRPEWDGLTESLTETQRLPEVVLELTAA